MLYNFETLRVSAKAFIASVTDPEARREPAKSALPEMFELSNQSGVSEATRDRCLGSVVKYKDGTCGYVPIKAGFTVRTDGPRMKVFLGGSFTTLTKEQVDTNVSEYSLAVLTIGDKKGNHADEVRVAGVQAKMEPVVDTSSEAPLTHLRVTVGDGEPKDLGVEEALALAGLTLLPAAGRQATAEGDAALKPGLPTVGDSNNTVVPAAWLAHGHAGSEFIMIQAKATDQEANVGLKYFSEYCAGLAKDPAVPAAGAAAIAVGLKVARTHGSWAAGDDTGPKESAIIAAASDFLQNLNGIMMGIPMDKLMDLGRRIAGLGSTGMGCDGIQAAALMHDALEQLSASATAASATDGGSAATGNSATPRCRHTTTDPVAARLFQGGDSAGDRMQADDGAAGTLASEPSVDEIGHLVPVDAKETEAGAILDMLGGQNVIKSFNELRGWVSLGGTEGDINASKARRAAADYSFFYEQALKCEEWEGANAPDTDWAARPANWADALERLEWVLQCAQVVGGLRVSMAAAGSEESGGAARSYAKVAGAGAAGGEDKQWKPPHGSVIALKPAKDSGRSYAMSTEVAATLCSRECIEAALELEATFAAEEAEKGVASSAATKLNRLFDIPKYGGFIRAGCFSNRCSVSDVPGKAEMVALPFILVDKVIALISAAIKAIVGVNLAAKHRADIQSLAEAFFKGGYVVEKLRALCGAVSPDDVDDQWQGRTGQLTGPTASADAERAAGVIGGFLELVYHRIAGSEMHKPMFGIVRFVQKSALYSDDSRVELEKEFWARLERANEHMRDNPDGPPADVEEIIKTLEGGKMVTIRHREEAVTAAQNATASYLSTPQAGGGRQQGAAGSAYKIPRTGTPQASRQTGAGQPRTKQPRKGKVGGVAAAPQGHTSSAASTPAGSPMLTSASPSPAAYPSGGVAGGAMGLPSAIHAPAAQQGAMPPPTPMRRFQASEYSFLPGTLTTPLSMGRAPTGAIDALEALADAGTTPCAWKALKGDCRKAQSPRGCPRCKAGHVFSPAAIAKVKAAMAPGLTL